jgi:hypothetical protein
MLTTRGVALTIDEHVFPGSIVIRDQSNDRRIPDFGGAAMRPMKPLSEMSK